MKKQSLIKGTVILGATGVFARFLGLFFRWPLIMLIGDEGVGYYQMPYPLYMFFIGLATGMPVAISKMVSERNALHDEAGMIEVFQKAMLTMLILSLGFSVVLLGFGKSLIQIFKWDPKAYYSLVAIGMAPIFIGAMSVFRGFFQGLQNMTNTAMSQLIEQIGRVVFGVGLAIILLPKGIEYSAGGAALGAAAGALLGVMYLSSRYLKFKKEFIVRKTYGDSTILTELLKIAIPVSLGAAVGTIMNLIDSIMLPRKLLQAGFSYKEVTILYGQLTGKASVITNVPLTLSIALCASLVPIIAEAYILNRRLEVIHKVESAIKVSTVIAFPSLCGLFFLSYPILSMLFPGHADGYSILKYTALSLPFIVLTQTSTAILQGTGYYYSPILNLIIGCIIKIVFTSILTPIPSIHIYGAVIGTVLGYTITAVLNMITMSRKLNIRINYYDTTIKPAYCSIIMIIGVVFVYQYVYNYTVSNGISCLISIFVGMIIYSLLIVFTGTFRYSYIKKKLLKK
jgi:stage V sporulation protein B